LGLAEALERRFGWGFEAKTLVYRPGGQIGDLLRMRTRFGINLKASDPLLPPWPDLIITAGLRNESISRWIASESGGRTKLVFIGRNWVSPDQIDLLITTPQYRVPEHSHVLQNTLTLHRVTEAQLDEAQRSSPLAGLPVPVTVVMVGGNSGPYTLGPHAARAMAAELNQLGGSLLVSGSARTPASFLDTLARGLRVRHCIYHFTPNDPANPYFAWLANSERICVTADSIALLSEAVATGKPVAVFDPLEYETDKRLAAIGYQWLMRYGPTRLSRDVNIIHTRLRHEGRVTTLAQAVQGQWSSSYERGVGNLWAAMERIEALLSVPGVQ